MRTGTGIFQWSWLKHGRLCTHSITHSADPEGQNIYPWLLFEGSGCPLALSSWAVQIETAFGHCHKIPPNTGDCPSGNSQSLSDSSSLYSTMPPGDNRLALCVGKVCHRTHLEDLTIMFIVFSWHILSGFLHSSIKKWDQIYVRYL